MTYRLDYVRPGTSTLVTSPLHTILFQVIAAVAGLATTGIVACTLYEVVRGDAAYPLWHWYNHSGDSTALCIIAAGAFGAATLILACVSRRRIAWTRLSKACLWIAAFATVAALVLELIKVADAWPGIRLDIQNALAWM